LCSFRAPILNGVWLWVVEVEVGVVPVVLLVAELRIDAVVVGEVAVVLLVAELRTEAVAVGEVAVVLVVEELRAGDVASAELELLLELLTPSRMQLNAVPQLLPAEHQLVKSGQQVALIGIHPFPQLAMSWEAQLETNAGFFVQ